MSLDFRSGKEILSLHEAFRQIPEEPANIIRHYTEARVNGFLGKWDFLGLYVSHRT